MLLEQYFACGDRVFSLGFKQADGFDVLHEFFFAERQERFRRAVAREKLAGGDIDGFVGRLCREQDGDQQLKIAAVFQFGRRIGIGRTQAGKNFFAFLWVHGVLALRRARARASAAWAAVRLSSVVLAMGAV